MAMAMGNEILKTKSKLELHMYLYVYRYKLDAIYTNYYS